MKKETGFELLTGRSQAHLQSLLPSTKLVHQDLIPDFAKLKMAAKKDGFDLQVISAYRSFEKQLQIWNDKAQGRRTLLDENGNQLEFSELSSQEIVQSIMKWSAIPGASRHHWGSDIDVFDGNVLEHKSVELTPQEVAPEGPMGEFHQWLDDRINNAESFGFFRPYEKYLGGVQPEKWHLSYAPVSEFLLESYTIDVFIENLEKSPIHFKEILLEKAQTLYQQYVKNISPAPF